MFILDPVFLKKCLPQDPRLGFLKEALQNLSMQLEQYGGNPLTVLYGDTLAVLEDLQNTHVIDQYFSGKSLSYAGKQRDEKIRERFGTGKFFLQCYHFRLKLRCFKKSWRGGSFGFIFKIVFQKHKQLNFKQNGERYFAEKLLDYDEPINIGNWQWSASVGADPKPLRIFSPILQAQRFDPNAEYIKKYIPELSHVEPKKLHAPHKFPFDYYPPIVDAKAEAKIAKERFFESGDVLRNLIES